MKSKAKETKVGAQKAERSEGHICFADRGSVKGWVRVDEPGPASEEFFAGPDGLVLYRAKADALLHKGVRAPAIACTTGAVQMKQFCESVECETPAAAARVIAEREAAAASRRESEKDGASMKGKKNGKSLLETWSDVFAKNEERVKEGKRPLTDEELTKEMEGFFPESKGKSTLTRVRMFRQHYNTGTHSFKKIGSAKERKLPESFKYDAKGNVILPGKRLAAKGEAAGGAEVVPPGKIVRRGRKPGPVAKGGSKKSVKKKVVRGKSK